MTYRYWILLLLVALLAGCQTISDKKEMDLLKQRAKLYGQAIRWGHIEDAYGYLKLAPGETVKLPDNLDNIRVTNYEEFIPVYQVDKTHGAQTVRIEYLFKDRQVIKTLADEQAWEFDAERKNWFRTNPIPEFR